MFYPTRLLTLVAFRSKTRVEEPTPYRIALTPWVIVQWHSPTQRTVIRRFRNRNDADNHLATLRQLMPEADLKVVFEPPPRLERE